MRGIWREKMATCNEELIQALDKQLQQSIPLWQHIDVVTQYQKSVFENVKGMCPWVDWYQDLLKLAPTNLMQEILRGWSFSIFNFTKEIRGNPQLESKIVTEVAGYGSQLGTIMDFLSVLEKQQKLDLNSLTEQELFRVLKFRELLRQINKAKGRPELSPERDIPQLVPESAKR